MGAVSNVVAFPADGELGAHPLADLFPLVEGREFDELISSIREDGQIEPIVVLDGLILDGRNRYRACRAAGIAPKTVPFTGRDPVRFVAAKNIHRRHLNEGQRALIAAHFVTRERGDNRRAVGDDPEVQICTSAMSGEEAAKVFNVGRQTVFNAKLVLNKGSHEEIQAVRDGAAAVGTIADQIRKNIPPGQRSVAKTRSVLEIGANPERIRRQQIEAEIWERLRTGLEAMNDLPDAAEVVAIVRKNASRRSTADPKIIPALSWLKDFAQAWSNSDA